MKPDGLRFSIGSWLRSSIRSCIPCNPGRMDLLGPEVFLRLIVQPLSLQALMEVACLQGPRSCSSSGWKAKL